MCCEAVLTLVQIQQDTPQVKGRQGSDLRDASVILSWRTRDKLRALTFTLIHQGSGRAVYCKWLSVFPPTPWEGVEGSIPSSLALQGQCSRTFLGCSHGGIHLKLK